MVTPNLWFSYSSGGYDMLTCDEPLSSPYTITYHMCRFLNQKAQEHGYTFRYVNLDDVTPQEFGPDDICVGHLWDAPNSFMQQALNANVKARIILQPYSAGMVSAGDIPRYIDMFMKADELLWVTGEHWFNTMPDSPFAALVPKSTRLDMFIDTALHPYSKRHWNKPNERAVCVIGHDTPTKGYRNVAELARVAGVRLGHFGSASPGTFDHVPHMTYHGGMVFTPDNIARVCDNYDALICLPLADANPTVLLEAAAWGLAVFCSKEAGYLAGAPFHELRTDDLHFNVQQMRAFQQASEYDLVRNSRALRYVMERDYTFAKMCKTIEEKVSAYL